MRPIVLALAVLALAQPVSAQTPNGAWLDADPLRNWNKAGAAIPCAPQNGVAADEAKRCRHAERPKTAAERAVAASGWLIFRARRPDPNRVYAMDFAIWAQSGFDGMCRPLGYQGFVLKRARFAGTISPHPMDARSDGAANPPPQPGETGVLIEFARYQRSDPLCCPSRISTVGYRVEETPKGPVLVARLVGTRRTER